MACQALRALSFYPVSRASPQVSGEELWIRFAMPQPRVLLHAACPKPHAVCAVRFAFLPHALRRRQPSRRRTILASATMHSRSEQNTGFKSSDSIVSWASVIRSEIRSMRSVK